MTTELAVLEIEASKHLEVIDCVKEIAAFKKSKRGDKEFTKFVDYKIKKYRGREKKQEKEPCQICLKHKSICERHHIPALSDIIYAQELYLPDGDVAIPLFERYMVWLCPVHHTYYHLLDNATLKGVDNLLETASVVADSISFDELKRLLQLVVDKNQFLFELKGIYQNAIG